MSRDEKKSSQPVSLLHPSETHDFHVSKHDRARISKARVVPSGQAWGNTPKFRPVHVVESMFQVVGQQASVLVMGRVVGANFGSC